MEINFVRFCERCLFKLTRSKWDFCDHSGNKKLEMRTMKNELDSYLRLPICQEKYCPFNNLQEKNNDEIL